MIVATSEGREDEDAGTGLLAGDQGLRHPQITTRPVPAPKPAGQTLALDYAMALPLPAVHLDQGSRHRHRQGHRPAAPQDINHVRYGALAHCGNEMQIAQWRDVCRCRLSSHFFMRRVASWTRLSRSRRLLSR